MHRKTVASPSLSCNSENFLSQKLHAYTRRRERENSRVKDLVDMALLLKMGLPDGAKLKEAIHRTFGRRGDGDFPLDLPDPPESWKQPYAQLAMECGLEWPMEESIRAVATRLAEI